jgi:hypothetical protein
MYPQRLLMLYSAALECVLGQHGASESKTAMLNALEKGRQVMESTFVAATPKDRDSMRANFNVMAQSVDNRFFSRNWLQPKKKKIP